MHHMTNVTLKSAAPACRIIAFTAVTLLYLKSFYSLIKYRYVLNMTVHELDKQGY